MEHGEWRSMATCDLPSIGRRRLVSYRQTRVRRRMGWLVVDTSRRADGIKKLQTWMQSKGAWGELVGRWSPLLCLIAASLLLFLWAPSNFLFFLEDSTSIYQPLARLSLSRVARHFSLISTASWAEQHCSSQREWALTSIACFCSPASADRSSGRRRPGRLGGDGDHEGRRRCVPRRRRQAVRPLPTSLVLSVLFFYYCPVRSYCSLLGQESRFGPAFEYASHILFLPLFIPFFFL